VGDLTQLVGVVTVHGHRQRKSCVGNALRAVHLARIQVNELGVEIAGLRINRANRCPPTIRLSNEDSSLRRLGSITRRLRIVGGIDPSSTWPVRRSCRSNA
jgi:hypothetical protein